MLSCTKHFGLVDSLTYFGRQMYSDDTSTYKMVKRGQFAYATNHIEEGSIGYQNLHDVALISPMYTVFETDSQVDDNFLYRVLKTEKYRRIFETSTNGTVNRRGSLRWKEFSQIRVPLPSLPEQNVSPKSWPPATAISTCWRASATRSSGRSAADAAAPHRPREGEGVITSLIAEHAESFLGDTHVSQEKTHSGGNAH